MGDIRGNSSKGTFCQINGDSLKIANYYNKFILEEAPKLIARLPESSRSCNIQNNLNFMFLTKTLIENVLKIRLIRKQNVVAMMRYQAVSENVKRSWQNPYFNN